ncbi:MAG: sensor histidine kinase [Actinomycetota bacterium]|jgi:signal transduction histidine kinase|nr:sensor histidine kinase [Actinomycetota bacterium]
MVSATEATTEELVRRLEELRASRQRLVSAQDEERRRLERDLHDGAQQHLVALRVHLGLAGAAIDAGPEELRAALDELQHLATEALQNLRDLAHGIYPPLLADEGLVVALRVHTRSAPLPVEVWGDALPRYAREAEMAVYFCCLEAVQNASKYSAASGIDIRLTDGDGALRFSIEDDGRGFDPAALTMGAGLQNMTDRVHALGGELSITSSPGAGTRIAGEIPTVTMPGPPSLTAAVPGTSLTKPAEVKPVSA